MKYLSTILFFCLALNCFADGIEPPAPSKPDGIIGGHEYVNLGLPSGTLWATCNIGSATPYEKGQFFAWGEVEPREDFSWESYKFFRGVESSPDFGQMAVLEDIGTNICGTEYDAARHQWGNGWRLPNEKERYELRMLCWSKYTTENGVSGVRVYGPNEHSIFLPVFGSGLWYGEKDFFDSTDSYYWTGESSPMYDYYERPLEPSNMAKGFIVQYHTTLQGGDITKASGICVRPVVNPKESGIDSVVAGSGKVTLTYRNGSIGMTGCDSDGTVNVYDLSGRLICSANTTDGACRLPEISRGIYLVSFLKNGDTVSTQKITVK